MKKEKQIAKENIQFIKECKEENNSIPAESHKASCERFLEFLEDLNLEIYLHQTNTKKKDYREKIIDLKQAIKLYDDACI